MRAFQTDSMSALTEISALTLLSLQETTWTSHCTSRSPSSSFASSSTPLLLPFPTSLSHRILGLHWVEETAMPLLVEWEGKKRLGDRNGGAGLDRKRREKGWAPPRLVVEEVLQVVIMSWNGRKRENSEWCGEAKKDVAVVVVVVHACMMTTSFCFCRFLLLFVLCTFRMNWWLWSTHVSWCLFIVSTISCFCGLIFCSVWYIVLPTNFKFQLGWSVRCWYKLGIFLLFLHMFINARTIDNSHL